MTTDEFNAWQLLTELEMRNTLGEFDNDRAITHD
jgi:hypothetical protein